MGLIIGLIGLLCATIYYSGVYLRFEAQVKKEKAISEDSVKKIVLKTRISGIILGISGSIMLFPTIADWKPYLVVLMLSIAMSMWVLTKGTRMGIERLEMKYDKE